jgi:peptidyl-prolyl cis-trans isomerase D
MRQHARSWLIKVLMTVIVLVFIFYFGYSFKARQGLKIALVNGEVISGLDYDKAYRNLYESFRRQYKDKWNEDIER